MIYRKKGKRLSLPGGFFHLENEKTKTRVVGYGYGDNIRLKDDYGNVWRGVAEKRREDEVYYHFRDSDGHTLTGISDSSLMVTLRDDRGNVWKGFVD